MALVLPRWIPVPRRAAREGTGEYDIRIQSGTARLIDSIRVEWDALCAALPACEPSFRPEAFAAYLACLEPDAAVVLVIASRNGQLAGVLPLLRERARFYGVPLTRLREIGDHVSGTPFDVICGAEHRDAIAAAIWAALARRRDWDLLEAVDVPPNGGLARLLAHARRDGSATATRVSRTSPFVPLPAELPADGQLPFGTTKFRANLRRRRRNLEACGPVRVHRYDRYDPAVLERFFALEASGWKGREGSAIAHDSRARAYFAAIARGAADGGYLSIYELTCADQTIAMHLGLTMNGRYQVPKLAYDEAWNAYAPGHLLIGEVIRDCIARGVREFDFQGNATAWKLEWTDQVRTFDRIFVFRRGPRGALAHAIRFVLLPRAKRWRAGIARLRERGMTHLRRST